jgi:flagellar FliJ protein
MGFTFRFETLRKVRKINENLTQQAFSQAQRHYFNLENLKNLRVAAKNNVQKELSSRMQKGLLAEQLKQYHDYLAFLDESIKQLDEKLIAAQKQVDEKRALMLGAKREHKAIERLKEVDEERYIKEQNRSEMRFIDEMAILRHGGSR